MTIPSRARLHQKCHVLDLVLINEEGMILNLNALAPLGKSDHSMLTFELCCHSERQPLIKKKKHYDKGNYAKLRDSLCLNWSVILSQHNVNKQ